MFSRNTSDLKKRKEETVLADNFMIRWLNLAEVALHKRIHNFFIILSVFFTLIFVSIHKAFVQNREGEREKKRKTIPTVMFIRHIQKAITTFRIFAIARCACKFNSKQLIIWFYSQVRPSQFLLWQRRSHDNGNAAIHTRCARKREHHSVRIVYARFYWLKQAD